jgi:hypothetical protein
MSLAKREHEPDSTLLWLIVLEPDITPCDVKNLFELEQQEHGSDEHQLQHESN